MYPKPDRPVILDVWSEVFLPSGRALHNPGLTEHDWERGIPRIHHRDPDRAAAIIRAVAEERGSGGGDPRTGTAGA